MHSNRWGRGCVLALAACVVLTGCGDDDPAVGSGDGTARFETWGEEYIEQGIPASELEDGWSVTYSKFLVVIGDVYVADDELGSGGSLAQHRLLDLVTPGPHDLGETTGLVEGNWRRVSFRVAPMSVAAETHPSASADDAALMQAGGYSVYVEGSATDGTVTHTFRWGFTDDTRYEDCVDVNGGQEVQGILVPDGAAVDVQLTIHGDHLFYDDLSSGDALLRFQNMADADADADGEVTLAELDAVQLADLPAEAGPYGVGAGDVNTLGDFVRASTQTLGHFNGEGHCVVLQ
jgi:hypothetical protein